MARQTKNINVNALTKRNQMRCINYVNKMIKVKSFSVKQQYTMHSAFFHMKKNNKTICLEESPMLIFSKPRVEREKCFTSYESLK